MIAIGKDDRITAAERYAISTGSADLSPALDRRCDVDKLIAAGWAARDPRRGAALALYRMAVTDNTQGLQTVVDTMDGWLNGWLARKGRRPVPKFQRRELVATVLRWWIRPTCGYCEGRGFELIPKDEEGGAGTLSTVTCPSCYGSGRRPIEREVPHGHKVAAQSLADELDKLVLVVTAEMARALRDQMPNLEVRS